MGIHPFLTHPFYGAFMDIMKNFAHGIFTVLRITGAPMLYRYPYRNSGQGLRSDWLNVGNDIRSVMGKMGESCHE